MPNDQAQHEPRLTGWGRHPESDKLLHFDVTGFGERVCVFRTANGWQAGTYRTIEEIAAQHADAPVATCPRCERPFATVEDIRGLTLRGKCPTLYAPFCPDAAKDCEKWEVIAKAFPLSSVASDAPAPASPPASEGRDYRSIAVKLAAFCCRLHGCDDIPERVTKEAIRLAHEFKTVERHLKSAASKGAKELPDSPGLWLRDGETWIVRNRNRTLVASMFCPDWYKAETEYDVPCEFREDMKGGWYPASAREEVERLRRENDDYRAGVKYTQQRLTTIAAELGCSGTMFHEFGYGNIEAAIKTQAARLAEVEAELRQSEFRTEEQIRDKQRILREYEDELAKVREENAEYWRVGIEFVAQPSPQAIGDALRAARNELTALRSAIGQKVAEWRAKANDEEIFPRMVCFQEEVSAALRCHADELEALAKEGK